MHSGDDRCAFCDPDNPSWTLDAKLLEDVDASNSELLSVGQGEGLASSLGTLAHHLGRLVATDTSTPLATLLLVLVGARRYNLKMIQLCKPTEYSQVGLRGADESSELALVLALDILQGKDSGSLLVHDRTETGLALDDHVGYTHLSAESREEDDKLNGVDIVSNDDE